MKESLCWKCNNTCGGCSWSKSFTPVKGWVASKRIFKYEDGRNIESFCVSSCPKFEKLKNSEYKECKAKTYSQFEKYGKYLSAKERQFCLVYLTQTGVDAAKKAWVVSKIFISQGCCYKGAI